jgi:hypothetical protein
MRFQDLPPELIAGIISQLDASGILACACTCKQLRRIVADDTLNPLRPAIIQHIANKEYPIELASLAAWFSIIPIRNWVVLLSQADHRFLLYEASLPRLRDSIWEEAFEKRFLPGWRQWKKDNMTWSTCFKRFILL